MITIKKGKVWWIGKEVTCPVCSSVLKLEENDIGNYRLSLVSEMHGIKIICAECGCSFIEQRIKERKLK